MSARASYRSTNLTCPVNERILICNIHRCSLVKQTGPKHFDVAAVHLPAGFFDHTYSITNVAAQRNEGSMWQVHATRKRCLIGYAGIFRGYGLYDMRVRASSRHQPRIVRVLRENTHVLTASTNSAPFDT